MNIDLTDLMESLKPDPVVFTYNGKDYTLPFESLTNDELDKLRDFSGSFASDADGLSFLGNLFGDNAPPIIDELKASLAAGGAASFGNHQRLVKQVSFIVMSILTAAADVTSNGRLNAATQEVVARVKASNALTEGE